MAMRNSMALCGVVLFAAPALAGELPKEGKYSGQYYSSGTSVIAMLGKDGKDGSMQGFDEICQTVGNGLRDHMTWRCIGAVGVFAEKARATGMCVVTDLPRSTHRRVCWKFCVIPGSNEAGGRGL
jgi:hypothetical protein